MRGIIFFHHHPSFWQLNGLLLPDPAVQEHEFLCQVSRIHLGAGHSRVLLRIERELEEFASKVLTVEVGAARESTRETYRRAARRRPEEMTGRPPCGIHSRKSKGLRHANCSRCRSLFLKRGSGKRMDSWAQSGRDVACQEARGLARLGERWGALHE